jgi:Kef-type K+ transport system membrane component KefB/K+/H+ antiporter YhaU regulatory subunit KhtT
MTHLPGLITDLALILGAAALTTLIFKKLKQPLVLGYLIAGFLVGPNFHLLPTVTDTASIEVWAKIGVIFLLFSLGLEFSFKKLIQVGAPASITAVLEVVTMLGIGYITGTLMGWSQLDSIFLGGVLSISSTTIIIRAFDELGVKGRKFAGLVFGILIVEDLVAIVLLVLLSTLAVSAQFSGMDMLWSVAKLVFFLMLWFLSGIFLLPTLLRRLKSLMSDETLLIISIALCLLMVWLAVVVGFSPELGAFIMGSILAETTYGGKIEHLIKSVKDLFGSIFFVSVGMLIDPQMLIQYGGPVILITVITIIGKTLSTTTGALLSGQSLKTSIQSGMSLSQIGEFSFIIATLGMTLKVTSGFLYPIAVAVSAITTFTTPYMIRLSDPLYNWLNKVLPVRFIKAINRYSNKPDNAENPAQWKILFRKLFSGVEHRLNKNLHEREKENNGANENIENLSPWDAHMEKFEVKPEWNGIGQTLQELRLRESFGINIATIERGSKIINAPKRDDVIFPYDQLTIIGTDEQLDKFRKDVELLTTTSENKKSEVTLWHYQVNEGSILVDKTIRESGIRERTRGLVVGVETKGQRIVNPDSSHIIHAGDVIWIVGDKLRLLSIRRAENTVRKS